MTERRVRIIHCRKPVHECGRPECRFARITEIQIPANILTNLLRITKRQLIEQIVRMLSIMQRLIVSRFAALKKKRVAAPAFGERIEAHH